MDLITSFVLAVIVLLTISTTILVFLLLIDIIFIKTNISKLISTVIVILLIATLTLGIWLL